MYRMPDRKKSGIFFVHKDVNKMLTAFWGDLIWTNIMSNVYKIFLIRGTLIVNKLCVLCGYDVSCRKGPCINISLTM